MSDLRRCTDRAELLREAARLMEADESHGFGGVGWACIAIGIAAHVLYGDYGDMRRYEASDAFRAMFDQPFGHKDDAEAREHRITSLCLLAAMVEAGDA